MPVMLDTATVKPKIERARGVRVHAHEWVKLDALLREHCKPAPDGYAEFDDGWDDERVRAEFSAITGREMSINSVQDYRRRTIGALRVASNLPVPVGDAEVRIASLETEVSDLRRAIRYLATRLGEDVEIFLGEAR
jgi:hypothetical protein